MLRIVVVGGQLAAAGAGVDRLAVRAAEHDVGRGVLEDVAQLGLAELRVQRHERHAGGQRAHDGHAGLEARLGPHGGALGPLQALGDRRRGLAQLAVGQRAVADPQGGSVAELVDGPQQRLSHGDRM